MSSPEPIATTSATEASLLVAFTRLEGKVDVALTQHGADIKSLTAVSADHEARLRAQEARPSASPEHEERIRALEARPTVSPKALWGAITSAGAFVLVILSILDRILPQ